MSRRAKITFAITAALALGASFAVKTVFADRVSCATPSSPTRYRDVAPIFAKHCGSCHDKRKSDNAAAQRVFESSRYPFATERPDTLLADLRHMFEVRSLSDAERCTALGWLDTGARDNRGKKPPYKPIAKSR